MKLPRPFVTKLSLATVLGASAALCWATPEASAGTIGGPVTLGDAIETTDEHGTGTAITALQPFAQAIASASSPNISKNGSAEAAVTYFFKVDGPPSVQVPLQIQSSTFYNVTNPSLIGSAQLRTNFDADASVSFRDPRPGHQPQLLNAVQIAYDGGDTANLLLNEDAVKTSTVNAESGFIFSISMHALVAVDNVVSINTIVLAAADPLITFAPGFDSTGFTLEFSPGVGNGTDSGTATPEPSTLVVWSIAFAMWAVVWAQRRRQRTTAPA